MEIEAEIERIQHFVDIGNYHAAINIALSTLNACHRGADQDCVDQFLTIINDIWKALARDFGSKTYQKRLNNTH